MPVYCYTAETDHGGETIERFFCMDDKPASIDLGDGRIAYRDIAAEHAGFTNSPDIWPMASDAAGVHPNQVEGVRDRARQRGIPTEFTRDGRPIFTSARHRKRYCEAVGLYDRNAGPSDPLPQNRT